MIGFVDPYQFTSVPAGLIIPWNSDSASPPTGWTFVTPPNNGVSGFSGCYIAGAGNLLAVGSSGIGGSPSGQVTFDSTYDGNHRGNATISTITSPDVQTNYFSSNRRRTSGDYAGNHNHTIDAIPTIGYNQYQFIKSSSQVEKFPANGILLNTTHSTIPWLTSTATDGKYLRAGNVTGTASTGLAITIDNSLDNGKHVHSWIAYKQPTNAVAQKKTCKYITLPAGPNVDGQAGYHLHDFNAVTLTDYLKKVYTTAWTYASDFYGFRGMIAFWDGILSTIPDGWNVCDGTNGTIDMRDHYVMMSTSANRGTRTGTNVIDLTPTSGNMLASQNFTNLPGGQGHKHYDNETVDDPDYSTNVYKTAWHEAFLKAHDHPLTQGTSLSFYPQYCALYIIQKL